MNKKNIFKIAVDIAMIALFVTFFNIGLLGFKFHVIGGIIFGALILVHIIVNRKWVVNITTVSYTHLDVLLKKQSNVLGTRCRKETAEKLKEIYDNVEYDELSRVLMIKNHEIKNIGKGTIAILAAGTSDIAVADEAYYTAKFLGNNVERIYDVGVAGIHRLLNKRHLIEQARVIAVSYTHLTNNRKSIIII